MKLMEIFRITSAQNDLIKQFSTFNRRKTPNLIMLDGPHLNTEYHVTTKQIPPSTLVSDHFVAHPEFTSFSSWPNLIQIPDSLMTKLSPSKNPSGILSIAPVPTISPSPATVHPLTIILERIQDPGNLGTMLRTANAMNAQQVLLLGDGADIWSAKSLRAGMGAQFHVFCQKIKSLRNWKNDFNGPLVGTSLQGDNLWAQPLPSPIALVFGNEGQGLSPETAALCDQNIKIPMNPKAESLNVAASLAILAHEFCRQQS